MKTMKKFASIMLAFVMCLCMAMPAMAASSSDTGSITVSGLESGVTVSAYQIAHATYDTASTGEFLGYEMNVNAGDFSIASDGSYDEEALTEANLSALYSALNGKEATGSAQASPDGVAVINNLPVGSYLLVVSGAESTVYGLMIGSVYYDTAGTVSGELDVNGTYAWAKATTPQVSKTEVGGSLGEDSHGGSVNLGDTLTYHITVDNIPSYQGENPEFKVTDVISDELTIMNIDALTVKVGDTTLVKGEDYTVTSTDNGFVIDFVVNGNYTLNDYAGQGLSLVIEYQVTVTGADDMDDNGADDHTNEVTLNFATSSYVTGDDGKSSNGEKDTDHDYTFAMRMQKTDTNSAALQGATFTLYTDGACNNEYMQNGSAVTATSNSEGYFTFSGLQEGTYYMKETSAPNGYTLNTTVFKVVISASYNADGTLSTWNIQITDGDTTVGSASNSSQTSATIPNTQVSSLPSTGGMGTTLFTIGGCILMLAAFALVVVMRRRTANSN